MIEVKHIQLDNVYNLLYDNTVFYNDLDSNNLLNQYINKNYETLKLEFSKKGKFFIKVENYKLSQDDLCALSYVYPKLLNFDLNDIHFSLNRLFENANLVEVGNPSKLLLIDTIEDFKTYISEIVVDIDDIDYLPNSIEELDEYIELDKEVKKRLNLILEEYQILKDKGKLLPILPIIEKFLNQNDDENLSVLIVDVNYNIYLQDYDNLEIKLRPLTKALYLLFLSHPKGIDLKDLIDYKETFLNFYKHLSNREDYDKMLLSVHQLLDVNTKEVYVHLSRIRTAFTKVLQPQIAQNYFISGAKNSPKSISLNENLIEWRRNVIISSEELEL